ncbi:MAG TPA: nuclear transport factor 2 family protein [Alphaproteobacteria bacterium]|nr:nuclear transport factor 2 family protein [Alphaproteobacteria bacterium]
MAADIGSLDRRIAALEDAARIKELKLAYFMNCDLKRPEEVAACFTPDAVIDYENVGRFDLAQYLDVYRRFGCRPTQLDAHHAGAPSITMTGLDTAKGVWPLHYVGVDLDARTMRQVNGVYYDEYIRVGWRWLISVTVMRLFSVIVSQIGNEGSVSITSLGQESGPAFRID